jgi:glycerol-3-phosphate acyltransferase PlsY
VEVLRYAGIAFVAYLLGSIPTGFLAARTRGIDIRTVGSGNIGATNAFRVLGKTVGTFVLLADALKGFLACKMLPSLFGLNTSQAAILGGLCAILGHNYTCWLAFKGGKGIATSAGVLLGWTPIGCGLAVAAWVIVATITRYVSVASICAAALLPFAAWISGSSSQIIWTTAFVGAMAIYKHKVNIQRLLAGTENRIGKKKTPPIPQEKTG